MSGGSYEYLYAATSLEDLLGLALDGAGRRGHPPLPLTGPCSNAGPLQPDWPADPYPTCEGRPAALNAARRAEHRQTHRVTSRKSNHL